MTTLRDGPPHFLGGPIFLKNFEEIVVLGGRIFNFMSFRK